MKKFRILLALLLLLVPQYIFARAGGGGADAVEGGIFVTILAVVLAPFFFIYSVVVTFLYRRKAARAKHLLNKLETGDPLWNYRLMNKRVEEVFYKLQKAWMERNQDLAKDDMSPVLYDRNKTQTDAMIQAGTINMLQSIMVKDITIIGVSDFRDNTQDSFKAMIRGSMIDYHIYESTKKVFRGDPAKSEEFKEIWTFARSGDKWIADNIDSEATSADLKNTEIYSQH